jgi:hypothetical protein
VQRLDGPAGDDRYGAERERQCAGQQCQLSASAER